MIVKVKEPQAVERKMLRDGQILYTYLHLAPDPEQTKDLVKSGAICIAYETVTNSRGGLPLLAPMSQVAGRMSIQSGAHCLEKAQGGSRHAARRRSRRGAGQGRHPRRRRRRHQCRGDGARHSAPMSSSSRRAPTGWKSWSSRFGTQLKTLYSTQGAVEDECATADLVIGGVLIPGAAAPKLVTRQMLKDWKNGSVLVDVAIDQGGCAETSKPTTHADPTYVVDGVIHYCVANMPGGVARTSTYRAQQCDPALRAEDRRQGLQAGAARRSPSAQRPQCLRGKVTYKAVADDLGYEYVPAEKALAA